MIKCEGSHMRCSGCACPCHGVPTEVKKQPPKPRVRPPEAPRDFAAHSARSNYMYNYRRSGPQRAATHPRDLPVETLKARVADGATLESLAREYLCDRRTIATAIGRYPRCTNDNCWSLSRRVVPALCRYCFAQSKSQTGRRR